MTRVTGCVKFFDDRKGFGFVTSDEGGPDVFIHRTDLAFPRDHGGALTLVEGQHVTFEQVQTPKGLKAINVDIEQNEPIR